METTSIIEWGGFLIIILLVFAETGLLIGLVVPGGETLVFTAGLLVSTSTLNVSLPWLLVSLVLASIAGDTSGYLIGKKFGGRLYHKEDTWYFKQKYLHMVSDFFKKHSKAALIFGKFLPVFRPFCPLFSGISNLKFPHFLALTVVASTIYMSAYVLAGYYLARQFPVIKDYLGWILPISIAVALIPVILQVRKQKKKVS
ncbi:DedA family protein [Pontibacter liquoris]|uniref:DedA family protein n=1 Tax=Pontibacter liquoris TaxID=2905677 RepID=UPI001FA80FFE|nr:DedA family protein [Pontibacter liquoris]